MISETAPDSPSAMARVTAACALLALANLVTVTSALRDAKDKPNLVSNTTFPGAPTALSHLASPSPSQSEPRTPSCLSRCPKHQPAGLLP